jgi:hypothetical protein
MKQRALLLLSAIVSFTGGCANPEIIQMSPGVYELARADHGGIFGNKDALKSGVIQDANVFAESRGKVAVPISAKEHPVGILGDWASYEYVFKIVDKDSSEARTPTLLVRADSVRNGGFTSLGSKDALYVAKPADATRGDNAPQSVSTIPAATTAPEATPTTVTDSTKSTADRLLELKKLLDAGALTKEEYDAKKKILLEKL